MLNTFQSGRNGGEDDYGRFFWKKLVAKSSPKSSRGFFSLGISQVLVGKIHKNHHERAVVYWTWSLGVISSARPIISAMGGCGFWLFFVEVSDLFLMS